MSSPTPKEPESQSVIDAVWRTVEIIEAHRREIGKHPWMRRTRVMIKKYGEKGAVRKLITDRKKSTGLDEIKEMDRLDCSFEQINIDDAFDEPWLVEKAKSNIAAARAEMAQIRGPTKC